MFNESIRLRLANGLFLTLDVEVDSNILKTAIGPSINEISTASGYCRDQNSIKLGFS
ncbi:MAG TPA: DUF1622 domain-containing protein [Nitrososphaeraceae archaeon]|nr:DUF1622 domain-containing protein [Nitrososphaeraceae archaeon]